MPNSWEAPAGTSVSFNVPNNWKAGRIWVRIIPFAIFISSECSSAQSSTFTQGRTQGCDFSTNPGPTSCVTGGCNGGLFCDVRTGTVSAYTISARS
jgi:hypothetical protein